MMPITFDDCDCGSIEIRSSWKGSAVLTTKETQTPQELYQFNEMETQTGPMTEILEDVINRDDNGDQLAHILAKYYPKYSINQWNQLICDRKVSIDGDIVNNPNFPVESEQYVEFVNISSHVQV